MRKLHLVLVVTVVLPALLVGCGPKQKNTSSNSISRPIPIQQINNVQTSQDKGVNNKVETVDVKRLQDVFGFADETGKYIITIENGSKITNPSEIDTAVGDNGKIIPIKYLKSQKANSKDNARQTSFNFNNMEGTVFEVLDGKAVTDKTYYLVNSKAFNTKAVIQMKEGDGSQLDSEIAKNIEVIKQRKIAKSWKLGELGSNKSIYLILFERINDDALASIVLIEKDKFVFNDYPAKYNEGSTWRVDDGGEIDTGMFNILFAAQTENGIILGNSWGAPEGESTYLLQEKGSKFEDMKIGTSRYWSP